MTRIVEWHEWGRRGAARREAASPFRAFRVLSCPFVAIFSSSAVPSLLRLLGVLGVLAVPSLILPAPAEWNFPCRRGVSQIRSRGEKSARPLDRGDSA